MTTFHYVKIDPYYSWIDTQCITNRGERINFSESSKYPMFPLHVMGPRDDGSQRRSAEHILVASEFNQIGQVCVATTKLLDVEFPVCDGKICAEPGFQARRVEILIDANVNQLRVTRRVGGHT
jgi:hypothetical protein